MMNNDRYVFSAAALAIASVLLLGGCKSKTAPTGTQPISGPIGTVTPLPQNPAPPQNSYTPATGSSAASPRGASGAQNPNSAGAPPAPQAPPAAPPAAAAPPMPQAPPPPQVVDLPAGTDLRVRLDQDLGSKISQAGDPFQCTLADDVIVNGQTVIAKGARANGTVIDAKPLGRFKGGALLELRLERVQTQWGSYPVATSSISKVEQGKGKRTGIFAGGGGALGAIIGGLAGGGKGALLGGLLGAGAGTAGSAFTGNKEILLPAETLLSFHLDHSVPITEQ